MVSWLLVSVLFSLSFSIVIAASVSLEGVEVTEEDLDNLFKDIDSNFDVAKQAMIANPDLVSLLSKSHLLIGNRAFQPRYSLALQYGILSLEDPRRLEKLRFFAEQGLGLCPPNLFQYFSWDAQYFTPRDDSAALLAELKEIYELDLINSEDFWYLVPCCPDSSLLFWMLEQGADVDCQFSRFDSTCPILFLMVCIPRFDLAYELVKAGANVNVPFPFPDSPNLWCATWDLLRDKRVRQPSLDLVKLLFIVTERTDNLIPLPPKYFDPIKSVPGRDGMQLVFRIVYGMETLKRTLSRGPADSVSAMRESILFCWKQLIACHYEPNTQEIFEELGICLGEPILKGLCNTPSGTLPIRPTELGESILSSNLEVHLRKGTLDLEYYRTADADGQFPLDRLIRSGHILPNTVALLKAAGVPCTLF